MTSEFYGYQADAPDAPGRWYPGSQKGPTQLALVGDELRCKDVYRHMQGMLISMAWSHVWQLRPKMAVCEQTLAGAGCGLGMPFYDYQDREHNHLTVFTPLQKDAETPLHFQMVFCYPGVPDRIHKDQQTQFDSTLPKQWCKL